MPVVAEVRDGICTSSGWKRQSPAALPLVLPTATFRSSHRSPERRGTLGSRREGSGRKIEVNDVSSRRGGGATAAVLVIATSLGEVALALQSWAACDVGINATANSLSMMYLGLPLLLICNAVVAAMVRWATGRVFRSSRRRRLWMRVTPALALAFVAYVVWAIVITDASYPGPICPGNVPPWVPAWVPS